VSIGEKRPREERSEKHGNTRREGNRGGDHTRRDVNNMSMPREE